ncbi:hypothetical protein D3C84_1095810 [compost metagenome]
MVNPFILLRSRAVVGLHAQLLLIQQCLLLLHFVKNAMPRRQQIRKNRSTLHSVIREQPLRRHDDQLSHRQSRVFRHLFEIRFHFLRQVNRESFGFVLFVLHG